MSKKTRKIAALVAVILVATVLFGVPAIAQNLSKTIEVFYRDIKIYINGDLIIPKDATGKIVEPFIYEGTTYLPIRAISEAFGMTAEWDGETNSAYLGGSIPKEITEVTVSTAEELIAALGSNKRIFLEEGTYNLTAVSPSYINNPSVYFQEIYDGPELQLDGIHNLTIQGIGNSPSEIVVEPRYSFVMNFINCSNISIESIKAGHTEGGYCTGGVFSFENSSGIQINDTQMYGCGTIGLSLLRVSDMKVTDSVIYECTYGIMYVGYSSDILFKDCVFRDNTGFIMVDIGQTNGFTIDFCQFLRNSTDYDFDPMFSISQSENVVIKNSKFADNKIDILVEPDKSVFDDSNTFENNKFD